MLVHVCQRWRIIIFASPRRLGLYLICSEGTRVRENLANWPVAIPLIVNNTYHRYAPDQEDDVLAALEHSDRVHRIEILGTDSLLNKVAKVMQKPFPALSHLSISWNDNGELLPVEPAPVIPRRFLGEYASKLQYLYLRHISVPHFPVLLSSARNLVTLHLNSIPQDGSTVAEGLAMSPCLTTLSIVRFNSETSAADGISGPQDPPIRAILPSLTVFHYRGYSEYLENFLAQIDTPRVDSVKIEYHEHLRPRERQVLQLSRFVHRTEKLKFNLIKRARILFNYDFSLQLAFPQRDWLQTKFSLTCLDMITPESVNTLGQLSATFSNVNHLSIYGYTEYLVEWLSFLRQFPAVKVLILSGRVTVHIVSVLADAARSGTDLFPALHHISFVDDKFDDEESDEEESGRKDEETLQWDIERFLSLRKRSGLPVALTDSRRLG